MADKLRKLYPLAAVIVPGEQPSAAKLTAMSTQAKAAIDKLEFVIGDPWNAAGDALLSPSGTITKNALHIPNLARAIGRLEGINTITYTPTPGNGMLYTDAIGTRYPNECEGLLKFKPHSTPSSGNMILGGTYAPLIQGQFKTVPGDLGTTGDWSVDVSGRLFAWDPIPSTMTLTYAPSVASQITDLSDNVDQSGWNVIPDPTTWGGAYDGVKISFANNTDATTGYHIWMPPRMPPGGSRQTYHTPDASTANKQSSPDSGSLLMYQTGTANAALTNGNHYRYNLPIEITGGAANSALPSGFLYIWDELFGTIVDSVSYYTPANTSHSKFKVRAVSADLVNVFGTSIGDGIITDDTTQLPADYISRFKLITVGASATKILSSVMQFMSNHCHQNGSGSRAVSHYDLDNLVTPEGGSHYPDNAPMFTPSYWENDDHTQYLHRGGSNYNPSQARDYWNNFVFNHLIVWSATYVTGIDVGTDPNGNATVVSANSPLYLYTAGAGQTSSSDNPGVAVGAGQVMTWADTNSNPDSMAVRGGGTTGVAQLKNAQFQKLYMAPDTNWSRGDTYFQWTQGSNLLQLIGADPTFETSTITADTQFLGTELGYAFITPVDAVVDISPSALNLQVPASAAYVNSGTVIQNVDASAGLDMLAPVHFPNAASLGGTNKFVVSYYLGGGSTGDVEFYLFYYTKPTTSGFAPPSAVTLASFVQSSTTLVQYTVSFANITSHTVDNTLYSYFVNVRLPHINGINAYAFYGGSIKYQLLALAP